MALVQKVSTAAIQGEIDRFANAFLQNFDLAQDLLAFRANLTPANIAAGWLVGDDGGPLVEGVRAELDARLAALQTFVTWANAGNPSPVNFLRSAKRSV